MYFHAKARWAEHGVTERVCVLYIYTKASPSNVSHLIHVQTDTSSPPREAHKWGISNGKKHKEGKRNFVISKQVKISAPFVSPIHIARSFPEGVSFSPFFRIQNQSRHGSFPPEESEDRATVPVPERSGILARPRKRPWSCSAG